MEARPHDARTTGAAHRLARGAALALLLTHAALAGRPCPAGAVEPATVSGTLTVDGQTTPLTHLSVVRHDDAEKLLGADEVRILVADRAVADSALFGVKTLPAEAMARAGALRGVLIRLDPQSPGIAVATILVKPKKPGDPFVQQTLSRSAAGEPLKNLRIGARVVGTIDWTDAAPAFEGMSSVTYKLDFSAPPAAEQAVTSELVGHDAVISPQADALRVRAAAEKDSVQAARLERLIPTVQRVVVRKDRAIAIFPRNIWMSLAQVGGVWKSDD